MPRASSTPSHRVPLPATGFTPDEWRLVSKLPAEVMIATVTIQDGRDAAPDARSQRHSDAGSARTQRRTVTEGLAGLDAIAAGRCWDSDLVRAVVAAIYAEPEEDRPQQPADEDDSQARLAQVLADCRRVVDILRAGADPADAAAYRHWVQQVAVRVCAASGSAGEPGRRAFLDELAAALF
jgi:hypothetical protein